MKFPKAQRQLRKIGVSHVGIQQVLSGRPMTSSADRESLARALSVIFESVDLLAKDIDMGGVMVTPWKI